ncbi:putative inorganic phosphate cotransporter [Halotydeus destructor]|nr:putative inorganic phosphate cotransporter [Halotydeus destructor]
MENGGVRYFILLLIMLSTAVDFITRTNINVTIVSMTWPVEKIDSISDLCSAQLSPRNSTSSPAMGSAPRFHWSTSTQSAVLGSFFYSYVAMQIPASKMAQVFGGKWVICLGLLGSGVINLITPLIASNTMLLITSRLALGICQAGFFTAGYGILFAWFPRPQRSTAYALMYTGANVGSILSTILSGYLSDYGFAGGWPSVFYVSGTIGIATCLVTMLYLTSEPSEHRWITQDELAHIREDNEEANLVDAATKRVPWVAILSSAPVWATTYQAFTTFFAYNVASSELPTYLSSTLHITSSENGLLNSLLYISTFASTPICGFISEWMIGKGIQSRTNIRKSFAAVTIWSTGLDCGATVPTVGEMSHNFPNIVFGIYNTVVVCSGFLAPMVAGYLLEAGSDTLHQWNILFYLTATMSFSSIVFSVLC